MANRFRYSLTTLLLLTATIALLLAGVKAHPKPSQMFNPSIGFSPLAAWAALANEVVFLVVAMSAVAFVGKRTGFAFAIGFVAFATTHWLLLKAGYSGTDAHPNMLHSVLIELWVRSALESTPVGIKTWTLSDLRSLLYALETLLAGTLGGFYAMWYGWRHRMRSRSKSQQG